MLIEDARAMASSASTNVSARQPSAAPPLRIVHCFRAPVGGLFRHVRDLAGAQAKAGHQVGIVCDSSTGGAFEESILDSMRPSLSLGIRRFPMRREIAPSDIAATWRMMREVRSFNPDILHAHGAKGGAYARTIGTLLRASGSRVARIYTPHGGSLHYAAGSLKGRVYFAAERALGWMTDAYIFVSQYEADAFAAKVSATKKPVTIARNGLQPDEFEPVTALPDARDFLFIGTMRDLKGPDVFIKALAAVAGPSGAAPTAVMVGSGDDKPRYEAMVAERRLPVVFRDPMPARQGFALARAVVVPSRAESMPYIVLEAIAAGVPLIATRVGGVPEIFGSESGRLVAPGNVERLANAMTATAASPADARYAAGRLRETIRARFSVDAMAAAIEGAYRQVTPH
jgi:glycosyltransferase involved in cell wall biosynthesis